MNKMQTFAACLLAGATAIAGAQGWAPQKTVELVVPNPPGGSNDKTARTIERIIVANKLVPAAITVMNRSGAGGTLAYTHTQQQQGDPNVLVVAGPALLTNHIIGAAKIHHTDLTPIASLVDDYTVLAVGSGSQLRTAKDLADRLRKDAKSVSIGFSPLLGSHNHIAAGLFMKAIGGNARDLRVVAYKGSAEVIPQVMGGHVDLVTTAAGNVAGPVANGQMRVIAHTGAQRLGGTLANVPTLREQGVNVVFGAWRAIFAPKGITPQQAAYWEGVLKRVTETAEWKEDLEKNYWAQVFVGGAQFAKELERDYGEMRAVLTDLGLAQAPR